MTELVPPEHRPWQRKIVRGVLVIGFLTIGVVGAVRMLRTHAGSGSRAASKSSRIIFATC